MSRNNADFGAGLGISKREENEIQGRAFGEHLYDGLEMIATGRKGGFKTENQTRALKKMRTFPEDNIRTDADGDPEAHITTGKWTSTWHGGGMITHHHSKHGPMDVTDITDYSNRDHGMFGPGPEMDFSTFEGHHNDFINYAKENDYPK